MISSFKKKKRKKDEKKSSTTIHRSSQFVLNNLLQSFASIDSIVDTFQNNSRFQEIQVSSTAIFTVNVRDLKITNRTILDEYEKDYDEMTWEKRYVACFERLIWTNDEINVAAADNTTVCEHQTDDMWRRTIMFVRMNSNKTSPKALFLISKMKTFVKHSQWLTIFFTVINNFMHNDKRETLIENVMNMKKILLCFLIIQSCCWFCDVLDFCRNERDDISSWFMK